MQVLDEIARELQKKQNNTLRAALFNTGLVLGTMTGHKKVKLDNFKHEVSCMLLHYLTVNEPYMQKTAQGQGSHPHGPSGEHSQYQGSGQHSHPESEGNHIHDLVTPEPLKSLKTGDRVLVAIVNKGSDHVIVGRVV
ncbi:hypothetical protein Amet_2561 [Alkaliphilus metalliredigens QYMF]|uniref:Uncharacterized protein n=1 Tax=Alkaliphilus metalliredigens (strain QYMF) TaxID=293826 RepID=A6TR95_ALKMQ|nr:hypothetical protein [Alkaliphilus metalliredigens]ABR48713.1 hypothetical protein Amet_2561 [Alkaliphilus metalliredigens QYMF]